MLLDMSPADIMRNIHSLYLLKRNIPCVARIFLSRGCLKIPSKMLLDGMKLLETCFIKQHGNNVSKIPGVIRRITDIMKKQLTD